MHAGRNQWDCRAVVQQWAGPGQGAPLLWHCAMHNKNLTDAAAKGGCGLVRRSGLMGLDAA
jgi:hypothetical protein